MAIRSGVTSRPLQRTLLACFAVATTGCDLVRDPAAFDVDDGPIALHAILVAGQRQIAVLVTRYESGGGFDQPAPLVAVPGATVRVTGAGQTVVLDADGTVEGCIEEDAYFGLEVPASLAPGCYTGRAEDAIAAGGQYALHISLDDGTIVTGEANVPLPVTVRTPEAGARIEIRSAFTESDVAPRQPFAWSDAGPDRAVWLWLEIDYENCQGPWTMQEPERSGFFDPAFGSLRAVDLTGRDSAEVGGWYLGCNGPPPDEIDGALRLAVFDVGYARYLDTLARSESIALADAALGVNGAVGVFTAAAVTRVPVRLIVRCPMDSCPWPD